MARVSRLPKDLIKAVQHCFGEKSFLKKALSDFIPRAVQETLALEIAQTIQSKTTLVAEAGTGIGKTFAYLVPSLLSQKKVIISTATKMLQDQLVSKDLPLLMRALGIGVRAQNLKGRANYICEYRVRTFSDTASFVERKSALQLVQIREQLPRLIEGVREELPDIEEDSPVWPYATSTAENCLGAECPVFKNCFLVKARKKAMDAEVVVINHHLFFADLNLKETGFGSLLPGVEVIIFDEAHQLPEIASDFFGERISTRMIIEWAADMQRACLLLQNAHFTSALSDLETQVEALKALGEEGERLPFQRLLVRPAFQKEWTAIQSHCKALSEQLAGMVVTGELSQLKERLQVFVKLLQQLMQQDNTQLVWAEKFRHHWVFHITPIEIGERYRTAVLPGVSYIYTSATLAVGQHFDAFTTRLGLSQFKTLLLLSPFDYQTQALMYLPRGLPDVKDALYHETLVKGVLPLIEAYQGRSFFLFTSYEAMYRVAEYLKTMTEYPLLVQGSEPKAILLAKFRQLGNAVLLGTATFWEGVDVKGDVLSCVIIDKLPFMSPNDPVTQGRLAYFEKQGQSGFHAYTLPAAVIALKQGVGRLIRDSQDRGIVVLADPRLVGRAYGKVFMESLPPFLKTRDKAKVLAFAKK